MDSLSDEEINELLKAAPQLHEDYSVFLLTPTTVAKFAFGISDPPIDAVEANAPNLVF
jgi:hypothetical protein